MATKKSWSYGIFATLTFFALAIIFWLSFMEHGENHNEFAPLFLALVILMLAAKIGSLVEKWGQPAVLGELVMGVVLGNLGLVGFHYFDLLKQNEILLFLAELGVVILLFQIGLESNIAEMKKVGFRAALVAVIGVVLPFVLGTWIFGPLILPGLSQNAYLFLGAALTATSVGITARVFRDLKKLHIPEAKIVLGAAVIDDVLGLIILAVVSALVTAGNVSLSTIAFITFKAVLFLVGAVVLGQLLAYGLSKIFSKIHTGIGMKFTLALSFGLFFAYLASVIGLAPIVGAFAAGLILDAVHFKAFKNPALVEEIKEAIKNIPEAKKQLQHVLQHHAEKHVEDLIEPVGIFLVPIFFLMTGMGVDLKILFQPATLLVALAVTLIAIFGKVLAGVVAGKVNKWLVGWGMVPRGEVGLIFATIGKSLGVVSDQVFSIIVIVVILTTLLPPPILTWLLKKTKA